MYLSAILRPLRGAVAAWMVAAMSFSSSLMAQVAYTAYHFNTLAGTAGVEGYAEGTGPAAKFDYPFGIAVDGSGNAYVADQSNAIVRKITPSGVVTTLAGLAGVTGTVQGTGSAARFFSPAAVAVDSSGFVYVADAAGTIRKITPGGTVTLLAGAPGNGSVDGFGATARFNNPYGIAVDGSGNVYVGDYANYTIRKITPAGLVSTLAGMPGVAGSADGLGSAARFQFPFGVAVDGSGNVYVADAGNHVIRKITPAGLVSTLAGSAGNAGNVDGTGSAARFDYPQGVAVDAAGDVYVAATYNASIRKITAGGVVTTLAGSGGLAGLGGADGTGPVAHFNYPTGVAVDGGGALYIADRVNHAIRYGYPNRAPTATSSSISTSVNQPVTFTLTGVDPDGDPLTYGLSGSSGGTFARSGNQVTFTPVGFSGVGTVTFTANDGYAPSAVGTVTISVGIPLPAITAQSAGQSQALGTTATLSVAVSSVSPVTYQWRFNDVAIPGATSATLVLDHLATAQGGNYSVVVSNSVGGFVVSAPIALTVTDSRLYAISCRARVGTGGDILIPGIAIGGSGSRQVVVRASGPAIQGVSGTLARPQLKLYQVGNPNPIASNTGWSSGTASETAALQAAFSEAGLPQYPAGSADCALLATVSAGSAYTATISGVDDTTGVALVEVYEVGAGNARLTALSCRARVGTGGDILIPGLIILGNTSKQVIIRAKGPGIQGVPGVLAQPTLACYSGAGVKLAENSGWSAAPNAAAIAAATAAVGLEPLAPGSADCAILTTLPPGGYTAQVSGLNGTTGIALIEIYEVP